MNLLGLFSGYKTYIIAVAAIVYAVGIHFGWWAHYPDLDLTLFGAGAITIRAAIKKLCVAVAEDPKFQALVLLFAVLVVLGLSGCARFASVGFTGTANPTTGEYGAGLDVRLKDPVAGLRK